MNLIPCDSNRFTNREMILSACIEAESVEYHFLHNIYISPLCNVFETRLTLALGFFPLPTGLIGCHLQYPSL